jgi:urocanate hydratase
MVIPNYSKPDDWEKMNLRRITIRAMTAGLYMYIGPQGIVHGTTITVLNAFRKINRSPSGGLFLTSGMRGSPTQAGNIWLHYGLC